MRNFLWRLLFFVVAAICCGYFGKALNWSWLYTHMIPFFAVLIAITLTMMAMKILEDPKNDPTGIAMAAAGIAGGMVLLLPTLFISAEMTHAGWYGEGHISCTYISGTPVGVVVARGSSDGREGRDGEARYFVVDVLQPETENGAEEYARHFFPMTDLDFDYPAEGARIRRNSGCWPSWEKNGESQAVQVHDEPTSSAVFREV